ncbi:gene transfer agent family protein [Jiella marina]|uniref:gene transfer agent family protein n=1 Tax=Jiella sp. LLJ827 TaxID=2917712 RepID=UPI002101C50B|nr:gene transfer agent family protein [Jiella sp. LLJ827]MCQ0986029.1 gene transfer agent family protein [Jiella sp. LLJ827]
MTPHKAFFGDSEHDFALQSDQIAELERVTGTGIGALCKRVFNRDFRFADVSETIRLALIGGGFDPQEAAALVNAYVPMAPLEQSISLAVDILAVLFFGPTQEEEVDIDMSGEIEVTP